MGRERQIHGVRDRSAMPPIATEILPRGSNEKGQPRFALQDNLVELFGNANGTSTVSRRIVGHFNGKL